MLNPIEIFKVAILHLNRAWNHCYPRVMPGGLGLSDHLLFYNGTIETYRNNLNI